MPKPPALPHSWNTPFICTGPIAHELLHQRGDDRPTSKTVRETEAEAVEFIVGTAIGIQSSVDASDYVRSTTGTRTRQSLHRIQVTAKSILSALPIETPKDGAHEVTRRAS